MLHNIDVFTFRDFRSAHFYNFTFDSWLLRLLRKWFRTLPNFITLQKQKVELRSTQPLPRPIMCLWEGSASLRLPRDTNIHKIINECERIPYTDPRPGESGYQPKYRWPHTVNFTRIQHKCIECALDHLAFGDNTGLLDPDDYWRDYWIRVPW